MIDGMLEGSEIAANCTAPTCFEIMGVSAGFSSFHHFVKLVPVIMVTQGEVNRYASVPQRLDQFCKVAAVAWFRSEWR